MRMKQNILTVTAPEKKENYLVQKTRSAQWNQILAGIVCVVGFLLIFSVTLYYAIIEVDNSSEVELSKVSRKISTYSLKCSTEIKEQTKCFVICRNIDLNDNLTALLETEVKKFPNGKKIIDELIINGFDIIGRRITQNWINTINFRIRQMTISSQEIDNVEKYSFKGYAFEELNLLTLDLVTIEVLEAEIFEGLHMLIELNFRNCKIYKINEKVLKTVAHTLQTLQVNRMKTLWDPVNLTGSIYLPVVTTVDFRYNTKMITRLDNRSFSQIDGCVQIFLLGSNIEQIECGTFEKMSSLNLIYLSQNTLTELQSCVFGDTILKNLRNNSIYVDGNKWNCNCDLYWLKKLKVENIVAGKPQCASHSNIPFEDACFCKEDCPNGTTPTTESSTSESATSTTSSNITETPTNTTSSSTTDPSTSTTGSITTESPPSNPPPMVTSIQCNGNPNENEIPTLIMSKTAQFNLRDEENGFHVQIINTIKSGNDSIIWFDEIEEKNNPQKTSCRTNLQNKSSFNASELEYGKSYTFCYLHDGQIASPWNCRSRSMPSSYGKRAWIMNEDKAIIIGMVAFTILIFCLIGATIVFIAIRKNPSLLRGSKRVVMVKKSDAIVLPAKFKERQLTNVENKSVEFTKDLAARTSFRRTHFRRSVSEISIVSGSYVSAAEPTAVQLLNWRLDRLRNRMDNERVIIETTTPPPLPVKPGSSCFSDDFDNYSGISIA